MQRIEALETIYPQLRERIVVTIMGAVAAELYSLGHRKNFFYLQHAMGLASSMGLGLAIKEVRDRAGRRPAAGHRAARRSRRAHAAGHPGRGRRPAVLELGSNE